MPESDHSMLEEPSALNEPEREVPDRFVQTEFPSMNRGTDRSPAEGFAAIYLRNSTLSVGRLLVSSVVALVLPSYLVRRLPVDIYAAWVLILQVSAYVAYFDFGIQTGIAKYVAEYEARNDVAGASSRASAGLALMVITSLLGVGSTFILAWQVPNLFHDMPANLYSEVRFSIVAIGFSISFGLLCSIFSSIFFGLQRYVIPTAITLVNRLFFTGAVIVSVALRQSLEVMGVLVAMVNIVTGLLQFQAWRMWARRIRLSLYGLSRPVVWNMLGYCSSLSVWTVAMLFISGLDVTIVGRYDFGQTAYYSLAILPPNFMTSIMGAALAPMMPATSALSVNHGANQLGALLTRTTRYAVIFLMAFGVPLVVGGYSILSVWLGPTYALHTIEYLRILVIANVFRSVCLPYATMLVATNSQRIAIAGAVAEAAANVISSIYLVRHIGAIGVAYGTLIGSVIGVGAHFMVNMHYTKRVFAVSRLRLLARGILRPSVISLPFLLLLPYWWPSSAARVGMQVWLFGGLSSVLLIWFAALNPEERNALFRLVNKSFT